MAGDELKKMAGDELKKLFPHVFLQRQAKKLVELTNGC